MVDLGQEIKARGRKPAFGPMSSTRNRRILAQTVEDEDKATAEAFQVRHVMMVCGEQRSQFVFRPWSVILVLEIGRLF